MLIGEAHKEQFREEGYFLLPEAIPKATVEALCAVCDHYIAEYKESPKRSRARKMRPIMGANSTPG